MITSKYIVIIYLTGDLVLIVNIVIIYTFENCILQFSFWMQGVCDT